jgi:phosphoribosylamine--glycine ligase
MRILLVGSGGREHALAEAIRRSPRTTELFLAPGSDALAALGTCVDLAADDVEGITRFARETKIDLAVIGPEMPLVRGSPTCSRRPAWSSDRRRRRRSSRGARSSPEPAAQYRIPTAEFRVFTEAHLAEIYVTEQVTTYPIVVKADGLAAGKGVVVAQDGAEAKDAIERMMRRLEFGDAGKRVVVEECLVGEEISVLAVTDGKTLCTLEPARDHKRVFDGDAGPNTGGMGAFCPSPLWTPALEAEIESRVLVPTLHALNREKLEYRGLLYAGIMLTGEGPKVLEYNCRFGDPETQVILPRLTTDFVELALGPRSSTSCPRSSSRPRSRSPSCSRRAATPAPSRRGCASAASRRRRRCRACGCITPGRGARMNNGSRTAAACWE